MRHSRDAVDRGDGGREWGSNPPRTGSQPFPDLKSGRPTGERFSSGIDLSAPGWDVHTHGGRRNTGIDAVQWARRMAQAGAGEILLTSMDRDGTKSGFDLELTRAVADAVPVPVIASGGVGELQHLADGIRLGRADAVLAASIFHYGQHTVGEAKRYMARQGIPMRITD